MQTQLGGNQGKAALIGFGNNQSYDFTGSTIDVTNSANTAFSAPANGTITSLSGYFSLSNALSLVGSTITITGQLYASTTPNNVFTPIPGAIVTLAPSMTGILAVGTTMNGITTGLSIPVTAQTRLMMVYTATVVAGIDTATTINGYVSGGLAINTQQTP
ncbi:hypothetical protein D3C75_438780 [compost metagenome]